VVWPTQNHHYTTQNHFLPKGLFTYFIVMAPRDRFMLDDIDTDEHSIGAEAINEGKRRGAKVTFHLVHVREFERVVGDHPEVKVGPPIALGWNYVTLSPVLLEVYDMERTLDSKRSSSSKAVERLTSIARKNILLEFGFTESDFRVAEQEVKLIQEQRSVTTKEDKKVVDERTKLQRIGRSLRKNFMRSLSATAKIMPPPSMFAY
jgi:hypothetical protein